MSAAPRAHALAACLHCGEPLDDGATTFCCTGCRVVYGLLASEHLGRYYDLRGRRGVPVPDAIPGRRDYRWLESIDGARAASGEVARVDLDVQGLHCSACVWLIETVFARQAGAVRVLVNPSLGRVQLLVGRAFALESFVRAVERFGYLFGPPLKEAAPRESGLVVRMGVCIAIAMNSMIFGIAFYAGLHEGPAYVLFQRLNFALSFASLVIGGSVFFRSAWQGLKHGILHLDLPIALGILLAFGGSVVSYAHGRERGIFVDTLDVFIALMLVGRWLQERVILRNRQGLLASDGAAGLLSRRAREGRVETVRCTELRAGDRLVLSPGDLVPADARVVSGESSFSLDWINGESRARRYAAGELVPAGAFLASAASATVIAECDFARSPLVDLLKNPMPREADAAMSIPWWRRLAKVYVAAVLGAATVGFAAWMLATGDVGRALEVTTAVLIVTCPCAFGIAMPLAYELTQAGLRRAGLFVRSAGFLDRAASVTQVVFDKTGTLTTGTLAVEDEAALRALDDGPRRILATMAAHSAHPKSMAIARALPDEPVDLDAHVTEDAGRGLTLRVGEDEWRLGAPSWVAPGSATEGAACDVAFGVNGARVAAITTGESLRRDAAREVSALRTSGRDVWLLSGDDPARAAQTARASGIAADHAVGGQSAEGKAAWVAARDRGDLLMIGDGINDGLVVARATCSGTPAIDRPFMAARSDFYFVTPGLRPIRLALDAARKLARVRRRNLTIAVAYNVLAVSLAYAGVMSPLVCAVFMPASSLTTILATTLSLSTRSALWRS